MEDLFSSKIMTPNVKTKLHRTRFRTTILVLKLPSQKLGSNICVAIIKLYSKLNRPVLQGIMGEKCRCTMLIQIYLHRLKDAIAAKGTSTKY